jgi:hypothetical protein
MLPITTTPKPWTPEATGWGKALAGDDPADARPVTSTRPL